MKVEKVDSFLRMSVLNAIITLKEYGISYPDKSIEELIDIIRNVGTYKSTYDYLGAKQFLESMHLSEVSNLRELITTIIKRESPSWMYQIPYGREIVSSCLIDNEKHNVLQCLESAGLYSKDPDATVIQWWDQLAALMRLNENESKVKSGRIGEQLTLEYEKGRLKGCSAKPKWVSIENNFAGYDVLSYQEDSSGLKQKLIEVKSCKSRPVTFYLSKNEWNCAVNFGDKYTFHVWYLPKELLLELSVSDIERNIPLDRESGQWQSVLINIDNMFL